MVNVSIFNSSIENISLAANRLKSGALIGLPTETVYGLAADGQNEFSVRRVYSVKSRPLNHPLIVHIGSTEYLDFWSQDIPSMAKILIEKFWPGPLTLIMKKSRNVGRFITSNQESIAIRMPRHNVALELLKKFHELGGMGIAAPSANRFGSVSPTSASDVLEDLGQFLDGTTDLIIDGGQSQIGIESTIVSCLTNKPIILRLGSISQLEIQENTGFQLDTLSGKNLINHSGKMAKHYSPKSSVVFNGPIQENDGFIALSDVATPPECIRLAKPTNLEQFARSLYSAFREGDKMKLSRIYVVLPNGNGIAEAIKDRVTRASNNSLKNHVH